MLNDRKVRLMTKLAMYEDGKGKEDVKLSKYYKSDYVRLQVLKSFVAVTFGYLLTLLLIAIYKSEYLIENAVDLNYKMISTNILGYYVIILTLTIVSAIIGYSIKYDKSRKQLTVYFRLLKKLRRIYREEDTSSIEPQREDI